MEILAGMGQIGIPRPRCQQYDCVIYVFIRGLMILVITLKISRVNVVMH